MNSISKKPNIIAFSGKMGAGKDTAAELFMLALVNEHMRRISSEELDVSLRGTVLSGKWKVKKFAYKLKKIASTLCGAEVEQLDNQEFKKRTMGKEWNFMTYREFLQRLGTEAIRTGIHPDAWVNALFADYHSTMSHWLITDCRFQNEANAVTRHGGIVVRIENPRLPIQEDPHPSETELDDYPFHYTIVNDGTMEEFYEKIQKMIDFYQLDNVK